MRHVKIARVALKSDRGAFQKLALDGKRKVTLSGWLGQAKQFYLNALADADILAKLGQFGVTQEKLQAAQQLLQEVETANAAQEKEKGEAQQATLERDAAFEKLDDWFVLLCSKPSPNFVFSSFSSLSSDSPSGWFQRNASPNLSPA